MGDNKYIIKCIKLGSYQCYEIKQLQQQQQTNKQQKKHQAKGETSVLRQGRMGQDMLLYYMDWIEKTSKMM